MCHIWVKAQWENEESQASTPLDIQVSVADADTFVFSINKDDGIGCKDDLQIRDLFSSSDTWTLRVNRSTIPAPLRLKDENKHDVKVMINNTPHYTLDAARLHNIGLIAYFKHDPPDPA
jgi:hypothetical protein